MTTHLTPTQENQPTDNTRVEVIDGERREVVLGAGVSAVAHVNQQYLLAHRFDVNVGLWAFPFSGTGSLRVDEGRLLAANAQSATAVQDGALLYALPSATESAGSLVWVDRTGRVIGQVGAEHADLSSGGGRQPTWTRQTGELTFVGGPVGEARHLMSATVARGAEVAISTPVKLFDIDHHIDVPRGFDVTPDGTRFLMVRRADTATFATRWIVVQNWTSELSATR